MIKACANALMPSTASNKNSDKTSHRIRKGVYHRLSLRRFSHNADATRGGGAASTDTTAPTETATLDSEIYPWTRCQQAVLQLAKGKRVSAVERSKVTVSIRNLLFNSQHLPNLLFNELLAGSLMQEAFKQLASAFDHCSSLNAISSLWTQFYTLILPDLHAVLYPFEEYTHRNVRKSILTVFRDSVILEQTICYGPLCKVKDLDRCPVIARMLYTLEQNTRDATAYYTKLCTLCERLLVHFASWGTATCDPSLAPSAPITFDAHLIHSQQSPPKVAHPRRGSLTPPKPDDQSTVAPARTFTDATSFHEHKTRSPLVRVKKALLDELGAGIIRRHSYTPGST